MSQVLWKIVRPGLWILDRRVRQLPRLAVVAGILLLGLGAPWLYRHGLQDRLAVLGSDEGTAAVASFLPTLFFVFVFAALFGLADILYQLYLTPDLELLMVAPLPGSAIFAAKLLQCSRATLLPAILSAGLLTAVGLARNAPPSYYLLIGLNILGAMVLATALMMSLVVVAGRLMPARRARSWLPIALALLSILIIPLQGPVTLWLSQQSGLLSFLSRALEDLGKVLVLTASVAGLGLCTSLIAYRIFDHAFYDGWNRFLEVPSRRSASHGSLATWLTRAMPAPLGAIVTKEWLVLGRTPQSLLNLAQPLVMGTIVATFALAGGARMRPVVFWILLMFLGLYLTLSGTTLQTAFAAEGRNLSLLQCAPVRTGTIMRGKFWGTWLLVAPVWGLVLLMLGMLFRLPMWQTGALVAITLWGLTCTSLAAGAIGALATDFAVQDLRRRLPALASWLTMGLSLAFALLTIAGALWMLVHLLPQSSPAIQLRALSGVGVVRAVASDSIWSPLVLLSGQLAFGLGVRALWAAGMSRLERYEEV